MAAGVKIIIGLMLIWIVFTILSVLIDGSGVFMSSDQSGALRWLTSFNTIGEDWLAIPKVALNFFTIGVPAMISWDYSWLQSSWGQIFRLIMQACSGIIIVWSIVVWVMPAMASVVANLFSGVAGLFRRY